MLEYCDGGDVFQRILQEKQFSEYDASNIIRQACEGLAHAHEMGYCHRDLKPDNLMYETQDKTSNIKIIDFGLAGDTNDGPCKTPCGTAHYAAPEVLEQKPYGVEVDCWSLGIIAYTLLCGFPPFFDSNNNQKNLYSMIKRAKFSYPSPYWDHISKDAKDLINKLLTKDRKERYSHYSHCFWFWFWVFSLCFLLFLMCVCVVCVLGLC